MSMALVMSEMPDLVRRVLTEHVPDGGGRCGGCRDTSGQTASWPCQTYRVAQEAQWVGQGNLPGTGPHGPVVPGARTERPARRRPEAPYSLETPRTGDTPSIVGTGGRRRRREDDAPFPTTGGHARHAAL